MEYSRSLPTMHSQIASEVPVHTCPQSRFSAEALHSSFTSSSQAVTQLRPCAVQNTEQLP